MKKILLLLSCMLFIFTSSLSFSQRSKKDSLFMKLHQFVSYVDNLYVDEVDQSKMVNQAIMAILEELDPHSTYIPADEVQRSNESIVGSFVGVGIRFQILRDTLLVIQPTPGGPSEKLGILPGDQIIKVDNELIAGIGLKNSGVRKRLLGEKGSKVLVVIKRKGEKELINFEITRDKIPLNSVVAKYMIDNKTGYIKLISFSRSSHKEVKDAIIELKKQGMKNLILDLQNNGGGLLYVAKQICDEFLDEDKLLVYSEGKSQPRRDLKSSFQGIWEDKSLVILTNEHSASASEIVSGAIQDWDRGAIIGRRTFGKGLVQKPIDLIDGSQIRLTIARYYTPSGRFIQKPYDNKEAFKNDYSNRYEKGEFFHKDSIDLPDSLLYYTLIKKRKVYGGGGIMPDIFVPIDTIGISNFFKKLRRKGFISKFALNFVNDNRTKLKNKFSNFDDFNNNFDIETELFSDFLNKVREDSIEIDKDDLKKSKNLIKLQLKAIVSQHLWGQNRFYQVINKENDALNRAIEFFNKKEYKKIYK